MNTSNLLDQLLKAGQQAMQKSSSSQTQGSGASAACSPGPVAAPWPPAR
jgi:hypothetical protein